MIEDRELRELFQAECEEHLQKLDDGLLQLEKQRGTPTDSSAMLKEMFREAHSLKGASRMLGVATVETLAHHFEDLLGAASRGSPTDQSRFTPELVDRLTYGLDAIRLLVREAVTGEAANLSVHEVLAQMKGEGAPPPKPTTAPMAAAFAAPMPPTVVVAAPPPSMAPPPPVTPPVPRKTTSPVMVPSEPVTPPVPVVATSPAPDKPPEKPPEKSAEEPVAEEETARIDTIRVDPRKLDQLLNQVGELTVVRTRIKRRMTDIDTLLDHWEECSRPGSSRLETALLAGDALRPMIEEIGTRLKQLRNAVFEDEAGLDLISRELEEGVRNLRLLPLSAIFNFFPRMVRDLARQTGRQVSLVLKGGDTTADKRILEDIKSPLTHLLRNAIHHGLESPEERRNQGKPAEGTLRLSASRTPTHVVVELEDDGRGLDPALLQRVALNRGIYTEAELAALRPEQLTSLIFLPGFSTAAVIDDLSGRGVGLDVVRSNVEHLKGTIRVTSEPGQGCRFTLKLPVTLATTPVFIVSAAGQQFAIPLDFIHSVSRVRRETIFAIEGRPAIALHGQPILVGHLAELLQLAPPAQASSLATKPPDKSAAPATGEAGENPTVPCILLNSGDDLFGLFVDEMIDQLEVVTKSHGDILKRVRNVSGVTILGSGEVCMVLNPLDLIRTGQSAVPMAHPDSPATADLEARNRVLPGAAPGKRLILLVEDSMTTRTQEKRILEAAGYEVITAVDGMDAYNKVGSHPFDAVVTDIQMPNLDGLSLTVKIRQNRQLQHLPVILVTSLATEEDMRRGMEAGANAYLAKSAFDQRILLETLRRMV